MVLVINKEGWEDDAIPTVEKEIPIENIRRIVGAENSRGLVIVTEDDDILIFSTTEAHFYYATFK